jgi:hypothetical protein
LYRPVLVIRWPTNSETTIEAPIIGTSSRPDVVADEPWTVC